MGGCGSPAVGTSGSRRAGGGGSAARGGSGGVGRRADGAVGRVGRAGRSGREAEPGRAGRRGGFEAGGAGARSGAEEVGGDADGAGGVAGGCGGAAAGAEAVGRPGSGGAGWGVERGADRERGGVAGRERLSPGVDRVWAAGSGQTGGPGGCWGGPSGGDGAGSKAGTDADRTSVGASASGVSGSGRRPPRRSANRRNSDDRSGPPLPGRAAGAGVAGLPDPEPGGAVGGAAARPAAGPPAAAGADGGSACPGPVEAAARRGTGSGAGRGAGRWVAGRSSGVGGFGAVDGPDVAGSVRPAAPLAGCRRRRVPRRGPASASRGSGRWRPPGGPVAALESAWVGVESELPGLDPGGPPRPWAGRVEGAAGADGPAVRVGSLVRAPGWAPRAVLPAGRDGGCRAVAASAPSPGRGVGTGRAILARSPGCRRSATRLR